MTSQNSSKTSVAKDVFAYLLTFVMLYIGVVSFITLLWQIINVQFPDPAQFYYQSSYDVMRNAIASLIVVWPVFLVMTRFIDKDIRKHHEKAEIWVRRWLTYLTIFVSAITIIVDLITLINSFLSGELKLQFVFKVLVILVVAGAVFGYEFWNLKREPSKGEKQLLWMSISSVVLILLGITVGFFVVGSPTKARDIRLDNERVNGLQSIQSQVVNYWDKTNVLPVVLTDLNDPIIGYTVPVDPVSKAAYEYFVETELSFKICATFTQKTPEGEMNRGFSYPAYDAFGLLMNETWQHESGHACFTRTIDPKLHATQQDLGPREVKLVP